MSRVDLILHKVLKNLNDEGARDHTPAEILDQMNEAEREIARRGLGLKMYRVLTLKAGTESYPVGEPLFKIAELIEPPEWKVRLTICDSLQQWAKSKRLLTIATEQPLFAFVWNHRLIFNPAPNATAKLEVFGYSLPVEPMVEGGDPQVEDDWDPCIEWYATAQFQDGPNKYIGLFEMKIRQRKDENQHEHLGGVQRTEHSSEDIGF
jgi:hypothetical protein